MDYENKENERVKSLFSGTAEQKPDPERIFGGLQKSPESANIFAQTKTIFGAGSNAFGTAGSGNSIFSPSLNTVPVSVSTPSTADSTKSEITTIFGGGAAKETPSAEGGNIFGGKSSFSFGSGSIFGGGLNAGENKPTFGGIAENKPLFGGGGDGKPLFGGSIFGNSSGTTATVTPVFGASSVASTFSFATAAKDLKDEGHVFGANKENEKNDDPKEARAVPDFLAKDNSLDFASLASGVAPEEGFLNTSNSNAAETKPGVGGFYGLTIKEDIFTKLAKQKNGDGDTTADGEHDDSGANDNYDPHYEPIIALPDEIKVSTGEEDEVKLFGERAKLFRFDTTNKEWKERGEI